MRVRLLTVSVFDPKRRVGLPGLLASLLAHSPPGGAEEKGTESFNFCCRTLALRRKGVAVSRGDPSEARQDIKA